jgi:SARP family transcriptional regulator, regulator of embCAB operon
MITINVLGALEVMDDDRVCTPSPPMVRRVLALLVLQANRVVHMDSLIGELWGFEPPRSAVTTVQTYIYHLRRLFEAEGLDTPGRRLLLTKPPGYVFRIAPEQVDATLFEQRVLRGRDLLDDDQPVEAAKTLRDALAMWTGQPLSNVTKGDHLYAYAIHLEELRINALELRIQADFKLGRHQQMIGELRSLVSAHPLNEWFHGQLISALSLSGRRSEALQSYQHLRSVLSEELGVDPSPALQALQHQVLSAGSTTWAPPALAAPAL